MSDASEAARHLAGQRWGTRRIDRLISELAERRDELGEPQRRALRRLVDDDRSETREASHR